MNVVLHELVDGIDLCEGPERTIASRCRRSKSGGKSDADHEHTAAKEGRYRTTENLPVAVNEPACRLDR